MSVLDTMSLADPKIASCPFDYYRAIRAEDPIHFDAKIGFHIVSRYDDILSVLKQPDVFSSELGFSAYQTNPYTEEVEQIMRTEGFGPDLNVFIKDPPYHSRIRAIVEKSFSAERVSQFEPAIVAAVKTLIDNFAERGHCEMVSEFCTVLPVDVIGDILGVDRSHRADFRRWSDDVLAPMGEYLTRERALEAARGDCELQHYVKGLIDERRVNPKNDMISLLVHTHIDDPENPTLSFDELLSVIRGLLVAGNDTTSLTISHGMLLLARRPDIAEGLRQSSDLSRACLRFSEELLRTAPAALGIPRMTTRETDLGGVHLPKGALLYLSLASANQDESKFPDAGNFDSSRKNLGQHLSFGSGIRRCIGALLARAEIKCAVQALVTRLDDIALAIDVEQVKFAPHLLTRKIVALPITFKARNPAADKQ